MCFTFATFEVVRTVSFLFLLTVIGLDMCYIIIKNIKTDLERCSPDIDNCLKRSIRFTLIHRIIAVASDVGLSSLYSGAFWFLVIAAWVAVKGHDIVPEYIYWLIVILTPVLFILLFRSLLFVCLATEMVVVIVRNFRIAASMQFAESKSLSSRKVTKILMKKCMSLALTPVQFVPTAQPMSRSFAKNYFQSIIDRLFDVILLF